MSLCNSTTVISPHLCLKHSYEHLYRVLKKEDRNHFKYLQQRELNAGVVDYPGDGRVQKPIKEEGRNPEKLATARNTRVSRLLPTYDYYFPYGNYAGAALGLSGL